MKEVFIVATARTPIGSFSGGLSGIPATELGSTVIKAVLERAGIAASDVNEVYMGNVLSANLGQAPANQASLGAGVPNNVPCTTINKVCASGMKAIMLGAQSILLGDNDVVVAGGMENMSATPYYLDKARRGYKMGNSTVIDGIIRDGLWDPYKDFHMGNAAELCATEYHITREEQDAYAIGSYKKAAAAWESGYYNAEVVPVQIPGKQVVTIAEDEDYKKVIFEKVSSLKPSFQKDGTITAANASNINDGAAAVVLVSGEKLKELGLKPLAKIISFADASQAPEWFTTTPVKAINKALAKAGLQIGDMDYAEINEAFSCVPIANARDLGLSLDKVNIWGGAVAMGHPIGCSGARIVVTLNAILHQQQARYGVAGICNGGGGASALIIERV
ncbi:acetyl-CoA C-acyltransferase [Chitinophaga sp. 30R24]|uniref:acetyl-CoA C-acyltransferase n=1 Tax=Chitinophaga sp. 30R24 TaxID=3248838 RepID=UPI003B90A8E6